MSPMLALARKELKAYFGSPMASIFIGAFLLSALFSFFWVETFFRAILLISGRSSAGCRCC